MLVYLANVQSFRPVHLHLTNINNTTIHQHNYLLQRQNFILFIQIVSLPIRYLFWPP